MEIGCLEIAFRESKTLQIRIVEQDPLEIVVGEGLMQADVSFAQVSHCELEILDILVAKRSIGVRLDGREC